MVSFTYWQSVRDPSFTKAHHPAKKLHNLRLRINRLHDNCIEQCKVADWFHLRIHNVRLVNGRHMKLHNLRLVSGRHMKLHNLRFVTSRRDPAVLPSCRGRVKDFPRDIAVFPSCRGGDPLYKKCLIRYIYKRKTLGNREP